MQWNHLPEVGGLYQQNPQLLEHFYYIFAQKAAEDAKERAKQTRESGGGRGLARSARGQR